MFALRETTDLLPHQEEFVSLIRVKKVVGCFDEPGLGKTLSILAAICELCKDGDKALIVVPPHLVTNWKCEIDKFTYLVDGKDIDIFPYTQLGKKLTSFNGYRFIASDEAHYLKNMDAQRTVKFMTYLDTNVPEYYSHATGTPVANRIPELYTFLLMLAGWSHVSPRIDALYPTYYQFCERFCHVKNVSYGSGIKYHGMKNIEELKEYLKPWTIRRLAKEVLTLPDMTNQRVIADYKDGSALAMAWAEHVSDGEIGGIDIVAKKEAAIAKAPFTAKWVIDELESGSGPVVVWSDHREPAEMIAEAIKKTGRLVGLIIGGQSMKERDRLVTAFQAGELDALVCTIGAGSTGLTLTRSNLAVFNDIPWVPKDLDQARKRVLRISQEKASRCVYIIGSKADDQIIEQIKAKMRVINAVVEA